MNPEKNIASTIMYKVNRNFLMQLLVTSCKKMKVYHVDDSQNWEIILDKFRLALLNEDYVMSTDIQEILGRGSVLSFRQSVVSRKTSFKEDTINFIEMPEKDEFNLILSSVDEIHENIRNTRSNDLLLFEKCKVENLTGDVAEITCTKFEESEKVIRADLDDKNDDNEQKNDSKDNVKNQGIVENGENTVIKSEGMKILFGVNQQDGSDIIWEPNNTDILFHTNTGIIGTMGTGKTQFTKSLITQLYLQRKGITESLENCIRKTFYKNEEDATQYYMDRVIRKKDLGGKYNSLALDGRYDYLNEENEDEDEDAIE